MLLSDYPHSLLMQVPLKLTGATAKNSWSLTRKPGPSNQGVRGSSTNYPFWPGENLCDMFTDISSVLLRWFG